MKAMIWILFAVFASVGVAVIVDEPDPVTQARQHLSPGDERNLHFHWISTKQYGIGRPVKAVAEPNDDGNLLFFYQPGISFSLPAQIGTIVPTLPDNACDSDDECEDETDKMCRDAGYTDGVDSEDVTRTVMEDGSVMCSGGCAGTSSSGGSGGVAFVSCSPR